MLFPSTREEIFSHCDQCFKCFASPLSISCNSFTSQLNHNYRWEWQSNWLAHTTPTHRHQKCVWHFRFWAFCLSFFRILDQKSMFWQLDQWISTLCSFTFIALVPPCLQSPAAHIKGYLNTQEQWSWPETQEDSFKISLLLPFMNNIFKYRRSKGPYK